MSAQALYECSQRASDRAFARNMEIKAAIAAGRECPVEGTETAQSVVLRPYASKIQLLPEAQRLLDEAILRQEKSS